MISTLRRVSRIGCASIGSKLLLWTAGLAEKFTGFLNAYLELTVVSEAACLVIRNRKGLLRNVIVRRG